MAHNARGTLSGNRQYLKEEIDACFARRDDLDPSERFAGRGVVREILIEERIVDLFRLLYFEKVDSIEPSAEEWLHSIARKIRGHESTSTYCNALANLLYARCSHESLKIFAEGLLNGTLPDAFCDNSRPLPDAEVCKVFGKVDGHCYWEQQSLFRPVQLVKYDEVVYEDQSCPLPFDEKPQLIGSGSFAKVYKVKIKKGHLIIDEASGSSYNDKYYAQKKFFDYQAETKKSFEAEGAILKKFIQATKRHDNILVTKASLEWGGTYSLFFDLAKYNLWDYFHDERVSITNQKKATVFGRTIGLAGALHFLHDELFVDSSSEKLHCYHLDLKPQNILVFEREERNGRDGNDIWKISDFGISKIKHVKRKGSDDQPSHSVSFLDSFFRPRKPEKDASSGVDNSRYGGTYSAPEARLDNSKVTRKSDIWSLGTVLTLVLTHIDNGSAGIKEFGKLRLQDRDNDRFFESEVPLVGKERIDVLHSSVTTWLDILVGRAKKRGQVEGTALEKAATYLKESMLLADQEKRHTAKQVEQKLISIQALLTKSAEATSRPAKDPSPKTASPTGLPHVELSPKRLFQHIENTFNMRKRQKHSSDENLGGKLFQLDRETKSCKLSHGGRYLAIESDEVISTMLVSDLQHEKPARIYSTPNGKWADWNIGSEYLCAAPESRCFECLYACLSDTTSSDKGHVRTSIETPVRKAVMSPNDEVTAFVLEESQDGKRILRLALYHTQHVLNVTTLSGTSPSNSSTPPESLPWHNIIEHPEQSVLPSTAGLVYLAFSSDSKLLIAVTEPYKNKPTHSLQYSIITWDVTQGRRVSALEIKLEAPDNMTKTIASLVQQPSVAAISHHRISLFSRQNPPSYQSTSQPLTASLLYILPNEEHQELILLGQPASSDEIRLFKVQIRSIDGLKSLGEGIETGLTGKSDTQLTCCYCESLEDRRRGVLVSTVECEEMEGRLSLIYLD